MADRSFKAPGGIAKPMDTGLRALQDYATPANARQLLADQEKLFGQSNENLRAAQKIKRGREEFVAAKLTLKSSALATPAIKINLTLGQTQWLFFERAPNAQQFNQTDAVNRNNVATTSERPLEIFETVTGQFERAM